MALQFSKRDKGLMKVEGTPTEALEFLNDFMLDNGMDSKVDYFLEDMDNIQKVKSAIEIVECEGGADFKLAAILARMCVDIMVHKMRNDMLTTNDADLRTKLKSIVTDWIEDNTINISQMPTN